MSQTDKETTKKIDQSTKLFNTAIIATKVLQMKNYSTRLNALVHTEAFHAIISAIQDYSSKSGKTEEEAAEEVIQTFREIDTIWDNYITQEGLEKLKGFLSP